MKKSVGWGAALTIGAAVSAASTVRAGPVVLAAHDLDAVTAGSPGDDPFAASSFWADPLAEVRDAAVPGASSSPGSSVVRVSHASSDGAVRTDVVVSYAYHIEN